MLNKRGPALTFQRTQDSSLVSCAPVAVGNARGHTLAMIHTQDERCYWLSHSGRALLLDEPLRTCTVIGWATQDFQDCCAKPNKVIHTTGSISQLGLCQAHSDGCSLSLDFCQSELLLARERTRCSGYLGRVHSGYSPHLCLFRLLCPTPQGQYKLLLHLGTEDPSACTATDYLLGVLISMEGPGECSAALGHPAHA